MMLGQSLPAPCASVLHHCRQPSGQVPVELMRELLRGGAAGDILVMSHLPLALGGVALDLQPLSLAPGFAPWGLFSF